MEKARKEQQSAWRRSWFLVPVGGCTGAILYPLIIAFVVFPRMYDLGNIDTPIALFIQFLFLMYESVSEGVAIGLVSGGLLMLVATVLRLRRQK